MKALRLLAELAGVPAQLAALADNLARHLNALKTALEHVGYQVVQLQHGPRTVTVLLFGETLDERGERRLTCAASTIALATGIDEARGYMQFQLPVAAGAWLVPIGCELSGVRVGAYANDAAPSAPSPVVRVSHPILIAQQLQFTVHRTRRDWTRRDG
jgi:hypothetical protein